MLGLAIAGCAQSRSSMPSPQPVGMEPVPSIHDTINRGTGDRAIQKSALNDPEDPRWSGKLAARGPRAGGPSGPRPQAARPGDPAGRPDAPDRAPQPLPALAGSAGRGGGSRSRGGVRHARRAAGNRRARPRRHGRAHGRCAPADGGARATFRSRRRPPRGGGTEVPECARSRSIGGAFPDSDPAPAAGAPAGEPGVHAVSPSRGSTAPAGDPLLGPNPDLMPAMDNPPPAADPKAPASRPETKPAPGPAREALPLEAPPPAPADPRPASGSGANPRPGPGRVRHRRSPPPPTPRPPGPRRCNRRRGATLQSSWRRRAPPTPRSRQSIGTGRKPGGPPRASATRSSRSTTSS